MSSCNINEAESSNFLQNIQRWTDLSSWQITQEIQLLCSFLINKSHILEDIKIHNLCKYLRALTIKKLFSTSEMITRHMLLDNIHIQCQNLYTFHIFLKNTIQLNPVFYMFVNIFKLKKKKHTKFHKTSCINISAEK